MGLATPGSKKQKQKHATETATTRCCCGAMLHKESTGLMMMMMMMTRGHTKDRQEENGKKHVNRVHRVLIAPSLFICVVIILITVKTRKYFCLTLLPDKPNDAEPA